MNINNINNNKIYSFHIRRAIDFTKSNYEESLSLDIISEFLGLNKCYFCNLFKKETGITYSNYVNKIRIEKSKKLLHHTNLSILEVALAVGYNNQNYYNMAFKRLIGTTPLKYRNKLRHVQ
ncbi:AraC family transcriptional regulator [Tissierella carlieri]|uniref:helix-turn-helix domain-containing protein n=1 Tax=Tissierella carlieri TaxID=689904 RepID=UPI001C104AA7|nr:AraC family transcriptional regulator [Tissierella carlieri]MBU5310610.1 AraC family transcriptional regulator [Tissierella carlieri]